MIDYDPHDWTSHLFDVDGSMLREIVGRMAASVLWAVVIVMVNGWVTPIVVSPTAHTLVGVALGLLLVFRTNASYDRFWEGRKMWGAMLNESRNLARGSWAHLRVHAPELATEIGRWTGAFAYSTLGTLRGKHGLGPITALLDPVEVETVMSTTHPPTAAAARITARLVAARDRGVISDYVLMGLDQNVQLLIDYLGACERIVKTPLPFVYVVHLRRALILYCFTLPLALVQFYGWWTVLATLLVSYLFFGIEEIGVEIENPFDIDPNDLPLEDMCEGIARDAMSILGPASLALGNDAGADGELNLLPRPDESSAP